MELNYSYDAVGNILSIGNESYCYDRLDRLVSGSGSWGLYNYSYDPAGNMLSIVQNGVNTSSTYGTNNQLLKMGSVNFTYDGNMLTKVNGSQTWSYSYDYENRLVNASLNSQLLQTNQYSSSGQRLVATDNGSSTVYVYEGGMVIYERNMTSGQVTDHFYANMLQVADTSNGTTYYYHENALGSIRLVTTSAVSITFSSNYVLFGLPVNATGIEEFQYTDKPVDAITGLYYFGARYDPAIGRFITEDSHAESPSDPLTQNRYIYVMDNLEIIMGPT